MKNILTIFIISFTLTSYASDNRDHQFRPGFTTKDNAGIFYDKDPENKLIAYQNQYCIKDQFLVVQENKKINVMRVACRQPDGSFAFIEEH